MRSTALAGYGCIFLVLLFFLIFASQSVLSQDDEEGDPPGIDPDTEPGDIPDPDPDIPDLPSNGGGSGSSSEPVEPYIDLVASPLVGPVKKSDLAGGTDIVNINYKHTFTQTSTYLETLSIDFTDDETAKAPKKGDLVVDVKPVLVVQNKEKEALEELVGDVELGTGTFERKEIQRMQIDITAPEGRDYVMTVVFAIPTNKLKDENGVLFDLSSIRLNQFKDGEFRILPTEIVPFENILPCDALSCVFKSRVEGNSVFVVTGLVPQEQTLTGCNNDGICQPARVEDPLTCPFDCAPVKRDTCQEGERSCYGNILQECKDGSWGHYDLCEKCRDEACLEPLSKKVQNTEQSNSLLTKPESTKASSFVVYIAIVLSLIGVIGVVVFLRGK